MRPQDRDKPNVDDDLQDNDRVEFHDHAHGHCHGIIAGKLGRGDEMLANNLHTKDGRSTHGHEMIYRVVNEANGTEREMLRSQLNKVGHREGFNAERIIESTLPPRSGALDPHPDRNAPRRH